MSIRALVLSIRALVPVLCVAVASAVASLSAQTAALPKPVPPEAAVVTGLAEGWKMLAEGRSAEAAAHAAGLLATHPRNASVVTFAVEAEVARAGWLAGLDQYERWLGTRTRRDEPLVARRVAMALLRETAGQPQNPTARLEALKALAEAGDTPAYEALWSASNSGQYAETRALAALGHHGAVGILIAAMNTGAIDSLEAIGALGESRSPLAAPALLRHLESPKPEVRGAAAEALGHVGGAEATLKLQATLRSDEVGYVRGRAAAALYRLGDDSGVVILRDMATAAAPLARLVAAEALAPRPDAAWAPLVESLIAVEQPDVVLRAASLMLRLDPVRARQALEALAASDNPAIREPAGLRLAEAVSEDLAALRRLLRSPDRLTRVGAARAILRWSN